MSNPLCPNCNVRLSLQELTDGWCETCGKRIPAGLRFERGSAPPWAKASQRGGLSRLANWLVRLCLAGILFVVAGCLGVPVWLPILPVGDLSPEEQSQIASRVGGGLAIAFVSLIVVLLVALGLKVLTDKDA